MFDMPSNNAVWGNYLRERGFRRMTLPDDTPADYTVSDFCKDHPHGVFVVVVAGHVVCVENGDYFDSWDSGNEFPIYYFERKEE